MSSRTPDLNGFRALDVEQKLQVIAAFKPKDPSTMPYLLEALGDSEWRVRKGGMDGIVALTFSHDVVDQVIRAAQASRNIDLWNSSAETLIRLGASTVIPLLGKIRGSDSHQKKFIVDILGALRDRRATPVCLSLISESDENVAMAAIEALGKLKDLRAVDLLIAVLRQNRPLVQFSAVKALQELDDGRAVEPLIAVLGRKTLELAVLEALGRIGDLRALNPLIQALRLGSVHVRHTVVRALVGLHHRMPPDTRTKIVCRLREIYENDIARYLLASLRDEETPVKRNAITLMGWMGDVNAIDAMVAVFDESCKEEIVTAFVQMQREAVPKLLDCLRHAPDELREGIARALGEIGDRKAVHGLALLASDSNGHVRQSTAVALGRLGDSMGIRPLLQLLEDPYPNVQEAAYHALTHFRGTIVIDRLFDLLGSSQPTLRCYAIKLLGVFKVGQAEAQLTLALKDPDPGIRHTALAALSTLGVDMDEMYRIALRDEAPSVRLETVRTLAGRPGSLVETLLPPVLHDPEAAIRAEVIRVLGERKNPALIDALLPLLGDPTGMITIAACDALGCLHARQATRALIDLLASADCEVRQAAVAALGELAEASTIGAVLPLLSDSDWSVRAAAAVALGKINAPSALRHLREVAQGDPDHLVRESARFALDQLTVAAERIA